MTSTPTVSRVVSVDSVHLRGPPVARRSAADGAAQASSCWLQRRYHGEAEGDRAGTSEQRSHLEVVRVPAMTPIGTGLLNELPPCDHSYPSSSRGWPPTALVSGGGARNRVR